MSTPAEIVPAISNGIGLRHSPSIAKLTEALSQAELEFAEVIKDTENPYYRSTYADLSALIKATRPALSKHGLVIVQAPRATEAGATVTTLLSHSSGEWIADDLTLPASKQDAQGFGSAITYCRRYAYQSILNIAGEEDDDGNAAVGKVQEDRKSKSTDKSPGTINPVQLRAFASACKTGGRTDQQIAKYLQVLELTDVEQIKKSDFEGAIKWALGKDDLEKQLDGSVKAAPITQKDFARLFAAAKERGVPENDVRTYGHESFKVDHLNELSRPQLEKILEWVQGQ